MHTDQIAIALWPEALTSLQKAVGLSSAIDQSPESWKALHGICTDLLNGAVIGLCHNKPLARLEFEKEVSLGRLRSAILASGCYNVNNLTVGARTLSVINDYRKGIEPTDEIVRAAVAAFGEIGDRIIALKMEIAASSVVSISRAAR